MFYRTFLKPIFFLSNPEKAHYRVFAALKMAMKIPGIPALISSCNHIKNDRLEVKMCGLEFKNPVGLAAGLDKNAVLFDELGALGFGFVEIGTVTPLSQPGNDKPRLFRLPEDEALINRMGFNNDGVDAVVARLKKKKTDVIIGGNIGKNKITPNENAIDDYLICFNKLHPYVDYFVVNVSSPNTANLRDLQEKEPLKKILVALQKANDEFKKNKPIFLKIAPDLTENQIDDIIEIVIETKIAGIIATNTTINREGLKTDDETVKQCGAGGLSGKPIKNRATEVIKYISKKSEGKFKIIGVGGIHQPKDAFEKLNAGADLIQVYTGFIYTGPGLMKKINKYLLQQWKK